MKIYLKTYKRVRANGKKDDRRKKKGAIDGYGVGKINKKIRKMEGYHSRRKT
jgi:hypothetical protein